MIKILRHGNIEMGAWSASTRPPTAWRARAHGCATTHEGVEGLIQAAGLRRYRRRVRRHQRRRPREERSAAARARPGIRMIDLTPAAIGPYCVPVVNLDQCLDAPNVNMVTCGGQATIPMVAAVSRVAKVHYARSWPRFQQVGRPGHARQHRRVHRDHLEGDRSVGGAAKGKAIIVLNPAEPPLIMRDTVYCLSERRRQPGNHRSLDRAHGRRRAAVCARLPPQAEGAVRPSFRPDSADHSGPGQFSGLKTSVFLEVEGAAHYLPAYAGNLDIMTSAALPRPSAWRRLAA
jgi:acetaldehyde dehydrogenase